MRHSKQFWSLALSTMTILIAAGCGSGSSTPAGPTTYATTSTKGDYAQWTVDSGTLTGTWQVTDGAGAVTKVLNVTASCGAADATYGYSTCTVSSASCTNGTATCASNDAPTSGSTFYMFEVPGTALFVEPTGGGSAQLQVGFAVDTSCSGVAGDYSFLHIGNDQTDLFGVYRTNGDMSSLSHADFTITNSSCTSGTSSGNCTSGTNVVTYSSGSATGAESVTSNTCSNGQRTLTLGGSATVRAMQSQSGVFILDLPSGQGGIVAFKTSNAAQLSDFANLSLGGIAFPDDSGPNLMAMTTGSVSGNNVPVTSISFKDSGPSIATNPVITPATNATSTATGPAYPDFTAAVSGTGSNTVWGSYGTPSAIPGLFRIDGTFGDAGRVILMATKYNGKVLAFGSVYNWRNPSDPGFSSVPSGAHYYNAGAFILFQK